MTDKIPHTTDGDFDRDVLESDKPVLVDFWADWCGPCKMIAPLLEAISDEFEDRLSIVKLNVDQNSQVPGKYMIRGIPTLLLFKDGAVAATKVGALSRAQLVEFVENNI